MPGWSDVDGSEAPEDYVRALEATHRDPELAQHVGVIVDLLAPARGETVIDLGVGTGRFAGPVRARGATVIGVDASAHMLRAARRVATGIGLLHGDLRRLPLRSGSADAVLLAGVLQHLSDAGVVLDEARRILRPGGRIVTSDSDVSRVRIEGVDADAAAVVAGFYARQREGRAVVAAVESELRERGFVDVVTRSRERVLADLSACDGMYGIATWGSAAVAEGLLPERWATRWGEQVRQANAEGRLRLRLRTMVASGIAR